MFMHLQEYLRDNGNLRVPREFKIAGRPLANWIKTQRQYYRRGDLEQVKIRLLESLPNWEWRDSRQARTKSVPKGRRNQ
jgi:hypothetical protein